MNIVGGMSILKNKLERLENRDDYYFLMNAWATGYHHWLAEVAPKFIHFEEELRRGKILMPKHRPHFISDFLDTLRFENVVDIEENAYASRINIVTNPNSGHYHPAHISAFRRAVLARLGVSAEHGSRRIYLTRRNARARRVLNESEVEEFLFANGFESIELEDVSFRRQVELFAQCKIFVSLHGAGLTNSLFMPKNGSVIEFYPEFRDRERELNACYKRLCGVLGHKHEFLFSDRRQTGRKPDFHQDDIKVSIPALRLVLEPLLEARI